MSKSLMPYIDANFIISKNKSKLNDNMLILSISEKLHVLSHIQIHMKKASLRLSS